MTTHIVSYSGGVSSFVVADWLVKRGIRPMLLFADTLIEDEDLYRFNRDVERYLNIPIKRIGKKNGFIRMKGKYLTMREFRDVKDANIDIFDFGGCGCAL